MTRTRAIHLVFGTAFAFSLCCHAETKADIHETWNSYGGDPGRTHYSLLDQINRENVNRLKVAWTFDSGDAEKGSQIQCTPIIIGDILYATSPKLKVFALNAATGKPIWEFNPFANQTSGQGINRGLMYWSKGEDKRILFTAGPHLYALDAASGQLIETFGNAGKVDLRAGLDRNAAELQVDATTPGAIYKDLVIIGSRVGETPNAAPGHIRAFNIRTGELSWIFHTIPYPGEFGYDTWPANAWKEVGGANSWGGRSLDRERGIVFVPTGSASYDFYGANRLGDNLFANSVIALDANSGKRLWHFQTVHHDLWDRDLPAPPSLVTLSRNNKPVDAVVQVTKSGFVFVFNRTTGESLFPIEEREVPTSDVFGEVASRTQPFPVKPPPFTRQTFTKESVTDISEEAREYVLKKLENVRYGSPFTPPSDQQETVIFPGFDGGAEWGGPAFDPESGYLYVNATELPWTYQLVKVSDEAGNPGKSVYQQNCVTCHGIDRKGNGKEFPSLIGVGQRLPYPKIAGIIRGGKGRMPGFPQMSFEDILLLLDYVNQSEPLKTEQAKRITDHKAAKASMFLHTGYFPFYDQNGYPAIKPPWGTLTAINLHKGEIDWQVPLGEYPELVKQGIRNTGTENYGGPIVTKGGLVIIAATMDEKLRAFNKTTGALLWETDLPASGFATPATYSVNGKQYLVIAAGGGKSGRISSGKYVAYALPDSDTPPINPP